MSTTAKIKKGIKYLLGTDRLGPYFPVYPDDTFIVSYPRSGNTWMRFLIANLIHSDLQVSFVNIDQLVPEIYLITRRELARVPCPRILKSHDHFNPRYRNVIYVVRDPRDVILSEYRHELRSRVIDDGFPMERFLDHFLDPAAHRLPGALENDEPFAPWGEHVASWIGARRNHKRFLLVRYADLQHDPHTELKRIAGFLGSDATSEHIARAVELSSADRMRKLEKNEREKWRLTAGQRRDIPFVGKAETGGWKEALPENCVAAIEAEWGDLMTSLGFELSGAGRGALHPPAAAAKSGAR